MSSFIDNYDPSIHTPELGNVNRGVSYLDPAPRAGDFVILRCKYDLPDIRGIFLSLIKRRDDWCWRLDSYLVLSNEGGVVVLRDSKWTIDILQSIRVAVG